MAILITGGAGYIGRFLANELAEQGQEVVAVDRQRPPEGIPPALPSGVEFRIADVTDRAAMVELAGIGPFSAVIHLAGLVKMAC